MSAERQLPQGNPFVLTPAYDLTDFQLVRTHWTKNFIRKFGAGEPVHAVMERVLSQIRADGYVVREYYAFPFSEGLLPAQVGVTAEEQLYHALRQLDRITFGFEMPALGQYLPRALLDGSHERHFGNDGTHWTVRFNPTLRHYLLNVAQLAEVLPPPLPRPTAPKAAKTALKTAGEDWLRPGPRRQ